MRIDTQVTGDREVRSELLRLGTVARQALDGTAEEAEEYIEGEAGSHSKGGALFRSVFKRRVQNGWELGHDLQVAPHALWVHWGAKPHDIKPKPGRPVKGAPGRPPKGKVPALRFAHGGGYFFAVVIHHPGNAPDPWLPRAAAQAPRIFDEQLQARLGRGA